MNTGTPLIGIVTDVFPTTTLLPQVNGVIDYETVNLAIVLLNPVFESANLTFENVTLFPIAQFYLLANGPFN